MRLLVFLLISSNLCSGGTIIQIKDFICGCEYCDTVNTGEPLDIGRHMIMCHSWKEATLKTIKIMNETKKPKLTDRNKTEAKPKNKTANAKKPNKQKHEWSQDSDGTWVFSNENHLLNKDGWIYRESMGWLWSFNKKMFLYSEYYGWLYNYKFNGKRVFYWYDRRKWILPTKPKN